MGFMFHAQNKQTNNHTGDECTNTNNNLPATNNNKRHVIVNLQSLTSIVNRNLMKCNLCRTGTQCLEVVSTNSFAVSLRICCAQCDKRSKGTSESYPRLEIKQDGIPYNKANQKVYNQVRQQKNRRKEKQMKYINQYNKQIIPTMQTKIGLPRIASIGQYGIVSYEINLRAI